ncbi:MAG: DUF2064 domain-containing protein [Candidatus Nanopelagicales bacterium]|nr:DUF2064 domain-containing protein [Candidatus Nanopelagicales bacterium]
MSLESQALTVIVIAKEPIPGRVKTRLTPAVTAVQAAALASAALHDTLELVSKADVGRRILLLDGARGDWIPAGFEVWQQAGGGLDLRLADAFDRVSGPALLIGMDTPQITSSDIVVDFADFDAWLGLTVDGGYWAVAMREPDPSVFPGVPMSLDTTGKIQLARLRQAGLEVGMLRSYRDVDTIADARVVAAGAPHTRFAMEFDRIDSNVDWPTEGVFDNALRHGSDLHLVHDQGERTVLNVRRWLAEPDDADHSLLDRCNGATLDIGCGPGRFTIALARRGHHSLGVDTAPTAVEITRAGGAAALCRSVFDTLPGEGHWDTVLLADGNLGIAGDPDRLLRRSHELLRTGGRLLVEPTSADVDHVVPVRLSNGRGNNSERFWWAQVGPSATVTRALAAGFEPLDSWSVSGRSFLSFIRS